MNNINRIIREMFGFRFTVNDGGKRRWLFWRLYFLDTVWPIIIIIIIIIVPTTYTDDTISLNETATRKLNFYLST